VVVRLRESHASRPWYGSHLLSKLRLVLQHGVDTGMLAVNAALRPGGLKPPRRHEVWSPEQIARFLDAAAPDIRLACALLIYTAQRPADVLSMTWDQIDTALDGRTWISLRQAKVGELVRVPAHRALAALLHDAPRRAEHVVPSPRGMAWSYRNFSRAWDRTRRRADYRLARELLRLGTPKDEIRERMLVGLQRRDIRRTAMVRLAEAGATTAQIAAVSGHTIDQTSRILDTYIPRRGEVAAAAIDAWERGPQAGAEAIMPPRRPRADPTATADVQPTATRSRSRNGNSP
jgi:integrase